MTQISKFLTCLLLTIFIFSSPAFAGNIIVTKEPINTNSTVFCTQNYTNDAECIQAALNAAKSGDTIYVYEGIYTLNKIITQNNKDLKIIGKGNPTLQIFGTDSNFGIWFKGSQVATQKLTATSSKGSSKITVADASKVKAGYLLRIHNDIKWCPERYPDQVQGESYLVKSVSGNTITLTEPLIREYKSIVSEIFVYDPISVKISGLKIIDNRPTSVRQGLVIFYSKNSEIKNCVFDSAGLANLNFYTTYCTSIHDNKIYNSVKPGSGYGVAIWSGSSYVKIYDNYIENCRHCISSNEADYYTLNRAMYVYRNTLIGGSLTGAEVVDAHACTLDYHVYNNKIYPKDGHFAITDSSYFLDFRNNTVVGGDNSGGLVIGRGNIKGSTRIIRGNTLEKGDYLYAFGGYGTGGKLYILDNVQKGGTAGILMWNSYADSFENICINGNQFKDLSAFGINYKLYANMGNISIKNNVFENVPKTSNSLIMLNGNGFSCKSAVIEKNTFKNVGGNLYSVVGISNVVIEKQATATKPIASFTAAPLSGKKGMTVKFTDRSSGSPTSYKWSFGDGYTSTSKSPSHVYKKAGKFSVTLTVKNGAGSSTLKKYSIVVK